MPTVLQSNPRRLAALILAASFVPAACATRREPETRTRPRTDREVETDRTETRTDTSTRTSTRRDKTVKGAVIGAGAGAATAVVVGKREAEQILIGAGIGAVAGAGIGAYLDAQEAKLARIPGTTVERLSDDTLLVRFDSDLLFPVDSAKPMPESLTTLAEVADVLVQYPKTAVVVQGHTDASGPEDYNVELSERRADAVKNLLIDRGVGTKRLAAIGHGEAYPVASNRLEEGRRRNRRVTVLLKGRA